MTVLLQMDKAVYSQYMIILFALSFIVYVPFNVIAQKIGKKKKRFKIIFINKDDQSNSVLASGNPCWMKCGGRLYYFVLFETSTIKYLTNFSWDAEYMVQFLVKEMYHDKSNHFQNNPIPH